MEKLIKCSQVVECDNPNQVNALLDLKWIILETIPIKYENGDGFIKTMMGNTGDKITPDDLKKILGRKHQGVAFL